MSTVLGDHTYRAHLPMSGLSAHPQHQSDLFRIPAELRIQIYEHVFQDPGVVTLRPEHTRLNTDSPSCLCLLQTCRQVYAEAEEIFYALNRFEGPEYGPGPTYVNTLRPCRLLAITKISITFERIYDLHDKLSRLSKLPNLSSLYIHQRCVLGRAQAYGWPTEEMLKRSLSRLSKLQDFKFTVDRSICLKPDERAAAAELDQMIKRIEEFVQCEVIGCRKDL